MKHLILSFFLIITVQLSAQQFLVTGVVTDQDNSPLPFANVRIEGTTTGTAATKDGLFQLRLPAGKYKLIASFIGFQSEIINIDLSGDIKDMNFRLMTIAVNLPEITVFPGDNPAFEIIRKAIEKKKERISNLNSYRFEAFTKGIVKSEDDIIAGRSSVSLRLGTVSDTTELKVTGVLENHSIGYFKKPSYYKEKILARKQTANFPPQINILTGGRLIQNFYEETIQFFGRPLVGPIADNALSYYYYYVEDTLAFDDKTVFRLRMFTDDENDPGFEGSVYITDKEFSLVKVELQLNNAANTGGIFEEINIFQQYALYDQSFYMPVDYRLFVTANVLGLIRFGFELNTILYDYKINPQIDNSFFDRAIVTVLPDADKKDSLYWYGVQTIPTTDDEIYAYFRIDSISNAPKSFWDTFSILSTRTNLSKHISVSAPLSMYHYNRIEGHSIDFAINANGLFDERLFLNTTTNYGFADKKFKFDFSGRYLLGDYRTTNISFSFFNKLNILFPEGEDYNELTATLYSLLAKYEFRDYYYSKGMKVNLSSEVFSFLKLNVGLSSRKDNSAFNMSEFSICAKNKSFSINPLINDGWVNTLSAGFGFDFRNYIEDGLYRRRITEGKAHLLIDGNIIASRKEILKSDFDFTRYNLSLRGYIPTFKSAAFNFRINGIYSEGSVPYQMLQALPGNIEYLGKNYSFRTLNVNEIFGDRNLTLFIEHNFRDELFRMSGISSLQKSELQLNIFLNAAVSSISDKTKNILPAQVSTLDKPFFEAGFGIGHLLFPFQLEFAWKLNQRTKNNFRIRFNAILF